ncbi:MAG TPA: phospholipase D-like domain-containing protein [Candidatus Binatia bacterium]|nr:phospholipase D-like domain-containing protein [Candidatus Binatia bacterium]
MFVHGDPGGKREPEEESPHTVLSPLRFVADRAFARAAGAPLIPGNSVQLLKDAKENYPLWLAAIAAATRTIHFESYIIHEDDCGRHFAQALSVKARAGVRVRVLYDWLGALTATSRRFWQDLRKAGVEVRCFNPPRFDSPLGWVSRDHRKMLVIDGCLGFVTGLCVGQSWVGNPARGVEAWRDTGVAIRGPAVADIERAFAQVWALAGPPLPEGELPRREDLPSVGTVALRVIASEPSTAGLYRLDTLVAAGARRSLWLTDAYFVGTTAYLQALVAAAKDAVDVRLLVPGSSDLVPIQALSRAGYRPLLEGGVRVFEWNGSMLHAKTAVADGRWARVGSSNLNPSSWLGNWELDVAVEDEGFARAMEEMFLQDLEQTTEIVLSAKRQVRASHTSVRRKSWRVHGQGSAGRAVAGALGIGNAVGAALTNHRTLGPAEAKLMMSGGLTLLAIAVIAVFWPRILTVPLAVFSAWVAVGLLGRAYKLHVAGEKERRLLSRSRAPAQKAVT